VKLINALSSVLIGHPRLDAADSVAAGKQPVAPAGRISPAIFGPLILPPWRNGRGHALRGLQFDAQIRQAPQ